MNVQLSKALAPVRLAMIEAVQQASARRVRIPNISCRPGCSACCKRFLSITLAEAVVIASYLKKNKRWDRVFAVSKEQQAIAFDVKPIVWFKMELPCPALNQNMCDAYQVRPVACSAHFATSEPDACSPTSTSLNTFQPLDMEDLHIRFAERFNALIGEKSMLRMRAPMPIAMLIGEKITMEPKSDFDTLVASMAREFGL